MGLRSDHSIYNDKELLHDSASFVSSISFSYPFAMAINIDFSSHSTTTPFPYSRQYHDCGRQTFEKEEICGFGFVELPHLPLMEHHERLRSLPTEFTNAKVTLQYNNGPLAEQELRRAKQPNPKFIDGEIDDTDYVKNKKCFYPGTMITS